MNTSRISRDLQARHRNELLRRNHEQSLEQIEAALAYGSLHRVHGLRRSGPWGEEPEAHAYAREARMVLGPNWRPGFLWGREQWSKRRSHHHGLVAWTEDHNGKTVRTWTRHLTDGEWAAYDTPGDRSCPGEATWLPACGPGLISFPALPFQLHRDGSPDPRVAETVRNLMALREFQLEVVDHERRFRRTERSSKEPS